MRKFLIAAVAVSGLVLSSPALKADEHEKDKGIKGILIDKSCSEKDGKLKSEADAAKHPASCVLKCADGGIGVTAGDKWVKLDEKGQKLAKEYLEKHKDDKDATKVHVEGKVSEDGKTIAATAIHAAKEKKDEKKES